MTESHPFNNRNFYGATKISGESMIGSGINDKDIAIIKRTTTANNGQIVVALIDKTEATLKKLKKTYLNLKN